MPVPWDESQVFYVWFDALLNYYTALKYARPGEDLTERFWPADFHLIGKDILKFHAVIWPAMLMAAEVELPRHLFIHGYLLMQGEKMSKTLGNVLDPFQVIDMYGVDALRYYCFREVSFGQDGSISTEGFEARYNTELANEYGNLASRTLAMIDRYRDGVVPGRAGAARALAADFDGLADAVRDRFDRAELTARARGDLVARRAAPEPLRRGAGAVEAGQGGQGRAARPGALRRSPRACAWSACCCTRTCPTRPRGCWRRSGQDDLSLERAEFGAVPGGATVAQAPAAVPEGRSDAGRVAP